MQPPAGEEARVPAPSTDPEACPLCGTTLDRDQDWCLRCGAAARTRLATAPNWKAPVVLLAVIAALALAVLAVALVKLAGKSNSNAPTATLTVPAAAAPVTPATGATSPATGATSQATVGTTPATAAPKTATAPRSGSTAAAGSTKRSTKSSTKKSGIGAEEGTITISSEEQVKVREAVEKLRKTSSKH